MITVVLVAGATGIIWAVWTAAYLWLTAGGRCERDPALVPALAAAWGVAGGQVARLRDLRKRATRFVFPQVSGLARHVAARHPRKPLRRGMTPEAVRPMLPPLRQRVTRAAVNARRRMHAPGLPGLRRLGVRSRPRRRLDPADAQTVTWLRGLSTRHPTQQAAVLRARIAVLAMVTAGAQPRWLPRTWAADMAARLGAQHLGAS